MSKGGLARRLRRAQRGSPLPAGVSILDIVETGETASEHGEFRTQETATFSFDPNLVRREVAERAVKRRLNAMAAVMGKVLRAPRRANQAEIQRARSLNPLGPEEV